MTYYGQSKPPEDQIADAVFGDFVGTCVEVGAYNGIDLSNTYHFYLKDWRCINFEPHPDNYAALCVNQPKAINVKCAAGALDFEYREIYTAPGKPIVTGFDLPQWYIDSEVPGGRKGLTTIEVPMNTVDIVLHSQVIETVDYISIDTDGTELLVLYGFDLNHWNPRLVIVEYNSALEAMKDYFAEHGYTLALDNGLNGFWVRTQADTDAVQGAVK